MRISDLSRQTGVPVATIKFYLRERLLPPGTPTGRNQAVYDEVHLRRLWCIRALTNVGQLDLSTVRALLASLDDEALTLGGLYDQIDRALARDGDPAPADPEGLRSARADVDRLVRGLGWQVGPDTAGHLRLTQVLATLRHLGCTWDVGHFRPYAEAAGRLAAMELDSRSPDPALGDRAAAVMRTVLLEVAVTAIHRMAQAHHVALRLHDATPRPRTA